jgi:hypothetical protein
VLIPVSSVACINGQLSASTFGVSKVALQFRAEALISPEHFTGHFPVLRKERASFLFPF